jgi:GDP-D-mannose 3',5'-epimerase
MVARIAANRSRSATTLADLRSWNSDNTRLREVLGWEPSIRLEQGLAVTFEWIAAQVLSKAPVSAVVSTAAD